MKKTLSILVLGLFVTTLAFAEAPKAATPEEVKAGQQQAVPEVLQDGQRVVPKGIVTDTNGDGKPDKWEYYLNGVIDRIEADTNADGKVDQWMTFKDGKIVKVARDTKGTGKPDQWAEY